MSRARTIKQKQRKLKRTADERELARKIKQGLLPRMVFKKVDGQLERDPVRSGRRKRGLTLALTTWAKAEEVSNEKK